ncbi:hypothetical protein [Embleya scabrispora]|uniref:hypothetical protein n=1 Tax=Embleya scabrispora TaxID=159449 RepID=UPI00117ECADE|nr:hypothetical protein [Embleya scabrispora]
MKALLRGLGLVLRALADELLREPECPRDMVTVDAYLRAAGASAEWRARWSPTVGRMVADSYRSRTGAEPAQVREWHNGAWRAVYAYPLTHVSQIQVAWSDCAFLPVAKARV